MAFVQDIQQILCFYNEGVAVCQKDTAHFDMAVVFSSHFQIFRHFFQRTDTEFLILIHIAECAGVSGTANGQLNDQAARLTGRSVNGSFISHQTSLLFCVIVVHIILLYRQNGDFINTHFFHLTMRRFLSIIGHELFR